MLEAVPPRRSWYMKDIAPTRAPQSGGVEEDPGVAEEPVEEVVEGVVKRYLLDFSKHGSELLMQ